MFFRRSRALHWAMKWAVVSSSSWQREHRTWDIWARICACDGQCEKFELVLREHTQINNGAGKVMGHLTNSHGKLPLKWCLFVPVCACWHVAAVCYSEYVYCSVSWQVCVCWFQYVTCSVSNGRLELVTSHAFPWSQWNSWRWDGLCIFYWLF